MKMIRVTLFASMLALLGGCIAVPVDPGPAAYYAPAYVGPSIGIGIYGRGGGYGHGRGHSRGYGYGRH